jgi:hypothetical protein
MSHIGPEELIYTNNIQEGIHSGGFSVKSIMMKGGMSPIMTLNTSDIKQYGGSPQVSDLFNDLVVPSWVLSYNQYGGETNKIRKNASDIDDDSDDDIIDDDLHDKLLDLVRHHDTQNKKNKITKNKNKVSNPKKGGNTKKRRG